MAPPSYEFAALGGVPLSGLRPVGGTDARGAGGRGKGESQDVSPTEIHEVTPAGVTTTDGIGDGRCAWRWMRVACAIAVVVVGAGLVACAVLSKGTTNDDEDTNVISKGTEDTNVIRKETAQPEPEETTTVAELFLNAARLYDAGAQIVGSGQATELATKYLNSFFQR